MSVLTLNLTRMWFDQIKSGEKTEEYREVTPYWKTRLVGRRYDAICFKLGYPKSDELSKIIYCDYNGYSTDCMVHEHFGDKHKSLFVLPIKNVRDDLNAS